MSWEKLLKDFTYKPGYELKVRDTGFGGVILHVRYTADNTRGGGTIMLDFRSNLPSFHRIGEVEAIHYLRHELHEMEIHESDENIRYKGEMLFDPHKKDTI